MVDIKGYESLYAITEDGKVWSYRKQMFLTPYGKDYLQVTLANKGHYKQYLVHRLVAEAFLPNPDNLPCVNHKDENKQNAHVSNLEWCTASYNNNFGTRNARDAEHKIGKPLDRRTKEKISTSLKKMYAAKKTITC